MTIAQIKALFQTGKIPTQADFENLISKIPNSESTGGGGISLLVLATLIMLMYLVIDLLLLVMKHLIYL